MNANIINTTDANFDHDVLESDLPVLLDAWASWCAPCRSLAPTIDKLASEYAGRVKVVKLDVQSNPATANSYNVRSIPALFLFKNGQVIDQMLGAVPKQKIENMLSKHGIKPDGPRMDPNDTLQRFSEEDDDATTGDSAASFEGDLGIVQRRGK